MLLEFRCDNFKSFKDGFVFPMQPRKGMNDLQYSILHRNIGDSIVNALSSSVVYGPNAAGKTSVVNAMSCMRKIVLSGTIRNAEEDRNNDHVSANMELAPFAFRDEGKSVTFDITFVQSGKKIRYAFSFFVGAFLEAKKDRYVEKEKLYLNDSLIYSRTEDSVESLNLDPIKEYLNIGYELKEIDKTKMAMSNNLVKDNLLLNTDFNSFCSKAIVNEIISWFTDCFIVVNSSNRTRFLPGIPEDEGQAIISDYLNRIAQEAGIIGSDFAYIMDPESHSTKLMSVLKKENQMLSGIDSDKIESVGTLRLISIMPVIIIALKKGATLVMDELDASLHPMIVMNLISLFHNDEVNKNGAQLIFNTHNPIYLNRKLMRRDEIKFVERNKETKSSVLYSLSDFKANGECSVRKTSDYMKNYFINRYGAIENIDFTDIIEEVINGSENNEGI